MISIKSTVALAGLAVVLFAASSVALNVEFASRVTMEPEVTPHDATRSTWVKRERANAEADLTLTVVVRVDEDRLRDLETVFWEVSDPTHNNYGHHLTVEEVADVLAVPQKRVDIVKNWLEAQGAKVVVAPHRDRFTVTMSIGQWEKALDTKIHRFTHSKRTDRTIHRAATQYSLPAFVASEVVMVGELLQFPALRRTDLQNLKGSGTWPNSCKSATCAGLVQPEVLAQRYSLPNTTVNAAGNSMAVAEFQGQYFEPSDLSSFSQSCNRPVEVATVIGGNEPSAGVEAELDIEYIRSVAPSIPLTVIYSAEYSLLNWANSINSNSSSAYVHSVSYGNDEKQQSSTAYMLSCNTAFMKAGTQGRSILFASGDQGVCGREGCGFFGMGAFHPDFPGGSPYITVVGGTDFVTYSIGDETTWSDGGGGFSNTFAIPSYQADAVKAYKANSGANLPPQKLWNNTGRGYPDIAALGGVKTPYCVATGGRFGGVAGTSAACPVAAGVFARLNGLRLAAGKSPMGFLNPWIYQNGDVFNDVTSGNNNGGGHYGFTAVKGWDAATGWGTPNFEAMSKKI